MGENERLAVVETRIDSVEDKISGISGMEKAIERLSVQSGNLEKRIIENQDATNEKIDKIADSLEKIIILNTEVSTIKENTFQLHEQFVKLENGLKEMDVRTTQCEQCLHRIEQKQISEADFKKERMKSRYAFWGAIVVAAISLIATVVTLIVR